MAYIIFDTETTGLHPEHGDKIIEIAAVRVVNSVITNEVFDSLINPHRLIPSEAAQIHGITNEMLQQAEDSSIVIPKFLQFVRSDVLVAHNAKFDIDFLKTEMEALKLDITKLPPVICTLEQTKLKLPSLGKYSLESLISHFGIPVERRHRALDDVKATAEVFLRIHEEEPTLF